MDKISKGHKRVKKLMSRKRIKFYDLAQAIDESYVMTRRASSCQNGITATTVNVRFKIAKHLGVDAYDIWPEYVMKTNLGSSTVQNLISGTQTDFENVRDLLHERGYSLSRTAKIMNLSYSTFHMFLSGRGKGDKVRARLATFLGIDKGFLWPSLYANPEDPLYPARQKHPNTWTLSEAEVRFMMSLPSEEGRELIRAKLEQLRSEDEQENSD